MSDKQKRALETRAAILISAASGFAGSGYAGTSLDEIATRSGIAKQTILYHFHNKEELWKEAVSELFSRVDQSYVEQLDRLDGREPDLEDLIAIFFENAAKFPEYISLPVIEGVADTWRSQFIAERFLKAHVDRFRKALARLQNDPNDGAPSALHLQVLIAGGANHFVALAPLWKNALGIDSRSPDFLRNYAETLTKLLT